jgi:hypothetical protein
MARTLPGGRRVFLVVYRATGVDSRRRVGDPVVAYVVGPGPGSVAPAGSESAATLSGLGQARPDDSAGVLLTIVPDGVARVEWTYPREDLLGRVYSYRRIIACVVGNVAAVTAAIPRYPGPSSTIWLTADGHTIKSATYEVFIPVPSNPSGKPAPETALSRRAERDPSTPKPEQHHPRDRLADH